MKAISLLADLIYPDQTYTILGRTIFDNVYLIQDLLQQVNRDSLSLALLYLNQEKAFDSVDQRYLMGTLPAFGFRPHIVGFLQVMYISAYCLVKINWALTKLITFG